MAPVECLGVSDNAALLVCDQWSADWPMITTIYLLLLRSTMTTILTKIDEATQPCLPQIPELM